MNPLKVDRFLHRLAVAIGRWVNRRLCRHMNPVHEKPRLRWNGGHPEVVGRYYCGDCGEGLPNPWRDYDHEVAAKMLYEARKR